MSLRARWAGAIAGLIALAFAAAPAGAHGVGMSTMQLTVSRSHIEGTWDLHLRDARLALGLDTEQTGAEGWRDLRGHEADLRTLLLRAIAIRGDSLECPVQLTPAPMEWDSQFSTVRFHVVSECPTAPSRLTMHCDLLFDVDPTHRAYFSVEDDRVTSVGVFRTGERSVTFAIRQFHFWSTAAEFIRDGIWHIWSGIDHMLFMVALLLPAPLVRSGRDWVPRAGLGSSVREVLKVVTAFTLAHSLTLCLSYFGLVRLREQWVEVGIALSVFAAAWNNLRPFLPGRAWAVAMTFGLVHGLGFAGALINLSLPRSARVVALAAFNVGVEIGQIVLVVLLLPLLYAGSRQRWYPRLVMGIGSLGIAWLAMVWVLERAFSLSLFSHR